MAHRVLSLVLAFALFSLLTTRCGATSRSRVNVFNVSGSGNQAPRCLDGSPPVYVIRPGYGSSSRNWIIFLEGGGWCFRSHDCLHRSTTTLGSSTGWTSQVGSMVFGGILSSNQSINPHFHDWTVAVLHYCDGGSYAGTSGRVVEPSTGSVLFLAGRRNLKASLQDMVHSRGLQSAKNVLLIGCSAGALGVSMACDTVAGWLQPYGARTRCVMDAGFFLDIQDVKGAYSWRNEIQNLAALHGFAHLGYDPDCQKAFLASGAVWKCAFPQYNLNYITTPIFVVETTMDYKAIAMTYDPYRSSVYRCVHSRKLSTCSAATRAKLQNYSAVAATSVRSIMSRKQHLRAPSGAFLFEKRSHCVLTGDDWGSVLPPASGGRTAIGLRAALWRWYAAT